MSVLTLHHYCITIASLLQDYLMLQYSENGMGLLWWSFLPLVYLENCEIRITDIHYFILCIPCLILQLFHFLKMDSVFVLKQKIFMCCSISKLENNEI